jgi:hypothetical protein
MQLLSAPCFRLHSTCVALICTAVCLLYTFSQVSALDSLFLNCIALHSVCSPSALCSRLHSPSSFCLLSTLDCILLVLRYILSALYLISVCSLLSALASILLPLHCIACIELHSVCSLSPLSFRLHSACSLSALCSCLLSALDCKLHCIALQSVCSLSPVCFRLHSRFSWLCFPLCSLRCALSLPYKCCL